MIQLAVCLFNMRGKLERDLAIWAGAYPARNGEADGFEVEPNARESPVGGSFPDPSDIEINFASADCFLNPSVKGIQTRVFGKVSDLEDIVVCPLLGETCAGVGQLTNRPRRAGGLKTRAVA